jgi:hypothetical protein
MLVSIFSFPFWFGSHFSSLKCFLLSNVALCLFLAVILVWLNICQRKVWDKDVSSYVKVLQKLYTFGST